MRPTVNIAYASRRPKPIINFDIYVENIPLRPIANALELFSPVSLWQSVDRVKCVPIGPGLVCPDTSTDSRSRSVAGNNSELAH